MNHERAEEMLARRNELALGEEAEIERHLASCGQCREAAEAYARQTALLRSIPKVTPPRELRDRLMEHVVPPSRAPIAHAQARADQGLAAGTNLGITERHDVPIWKRDPRLYALAVPLAALFLFAAIGLAHFGRQSPAHTAFAPPTRAASFGHQQSKPSPTAASTQRRQRQASPTPAAAISNAAVPSTLVAQQQASSIPQLTPTPPSPRATVQVAPVGGRPPRVAATPSHGGHAAGPVVAPLPPPNSPPAVRPTPKPTNVVLAPVVTSTPVSTPIRTPVVAIPSTVTTGATATPSVTATP